MYLFLCTYTEYHVLQLYNRSEKSLILLLFYAKKVHIFMITMKRQFNGCVDNNEFYYAVRKVKHVFRMKKLNDVKYIMTIKALLHT